jgi:hypothetical protein
MTQVAPPYPVFADLDGSPLDAGYIYLGSVNQNPETTPIPVYWDQALTIPAAQPIRTIGGYPSRSGTPATLYTDGTFSITVRDKRRSLVFYSPVGYAVNTNSVAADANIVIVANNITSVNTVATNIADVSAVNTDIGSVKAVAGDLGGTWGTGVTYDFGAITDAPVGVISPPGGNIVIVAANITDIVTVADNIVPVVIVATNIDAILASVAGALQRALNLSDLTDVAVARTNLGLGDVAVLNEIGVADLAATLDYGSIV